MNDTSAWVEDYVFWSGPGQYRSVIEGGRRVWSKTTEPGDTLYLISRRQAVNLGKVFDVGGDGA